MALPWDGASLRAEFHGQAEQAAHALAAQAQAICAKDPIACAAQAISLGRGADGSRSQHICRPAISRPHGAAPPP